MFEKLEITAMASAMASHAEARMGLIARNVANADTPGYRAMDLPDFATAYDAAVPLDMRATLPAHLTSAAGFAAQAGFSPDDESPNGNTVSVEGQMVRAAGAKSEHDMALAIYRSTSGILRASLGSRG